MVYIVVLAPYEKLEDPTQTRYCAHFVESDSDNEADIIGEFYDIDIPIRDSKLVAHIVGIYNDTKLYIEARYIFGIDIRMLIALAKLENKKFKYENIDESKYKDTHVIIDINCFLKDGN